MPRTRDLSRGTTLRLPSNTRRSWEFAAEGEAVKSYPADDEAVPMRGRGERRRRAPRTARAPGVKKTQALQPGTVVILLGGAQKGKKAVFLKTCRSGLLLVSGVFSENGVPLRRVNRRYCIATSTVVDGVSGIKDITTLNDGYFSRRRDAEAPADEEGNSKNVTVVSDTRRNTQQSIDGQLKELIAGTPLLQEYINAKFSLKNGDVPHLMRF